MAEQTPPVEVLLTADASDFNNEVSGSISRLFSMQGAVLGVSAALGFMASKAIANAVKAMAEFESSMAGVQKVTNVSDEMLGKIGGRLKEISTELGVSVEQLAEFAEGAARAGVRGEEALAKFAETVAKADIATELEGDEMADQLARLIKFLGLANEDVETVVSTINELGNQLPTNAERILDATSRMSSDFRALGLTAQQVLGLAAAASTLRESSRNAARRARSLAQDMLTPSKLEGIAEAFGTTSDQIAKLRDSAPLPTLLALSQIMSSNTAAGERLADVFGKRASGVLRNFGGNMEDVQKALKIANEEFGLTQSLNEEVAIFMDTVNKKWDTFQETLHVTAIEIGQFLKPAILGILGILNTMAESFRDINRATDGLFGTFLLITGAVLGLSIAVRSFSQIFRVTRGQISEAIGPITFLAAKIIAVIGATAILVTAWKEDWLGIRSTVTSVIDFIAPKIDSLIRKVKSFIGSFVSGFNRLDETTGGTLLKIGKFIAIVVSIGTLIASIVLPVLGILKSVLLSLIPSGFIGTITGIITSFISWVSASGIVSGALSILGSVIGALSAPILLVIGLIASLVAAFVLNIGNLRTFVMKNLRQLGKLFERHFGEVLNEARKTFSFWIKVILGALTFVARGAKRVLNPMAEFFGFIFGVIFDVVKLFADDFIAIVKFGLDIVFGAIKFWFGLIMTAFKVFFALLRGDWKTAWKFIKDFVKETLDGVTSFIKTWGSGFVDGIGNVIDDIKQLWRDFKTWLIGNSFIPDTFGAVTDWIKNSWAGKVTAAVSNVVSKIKDMVSEGIEKLQELVEKERKTKEKIETISSDHEAEQAARAAQNATDFNSSSSSSDTLVSTNGGMATAITNDIKNINVDATISANSKSEGASAARGLKDELQSNGFSLQ